MSSDLIKPIDLLKSNSKDGLFGPSHIRAIFSYGVGVPVTPEFDEKECSSKGLM